MADEVVGELELEIIVHNLTRDGADTWIADIEIPEWGVTRKGVYLHGATEEEAYADVHNLVHIVIGPRP